MAKTITRYMYDRYQKVLAYQKKMGVSQAIAMKKIGMGSSSFAHVKNRLAAKAQVVDKGWKRSGPKASRKAKKPNPKTESFRMELASPPPVLSHVGEGIEVMVVKGDPVKVAEFLEICRR